MPTTRGRFPKLTDGQIQLVLCSSTRRAAFRVSHGTLPDLARRLNVQVCSIRYLLRRATAAPFCDRVKSARGVFGEMEFISGSPGTSLNCLPENQKQLSSADNGAKLTLTEKLTYAQR